MTLATAHSIANGSRPSEAMLTELLDSPELAKTWLERHDHALEQSV